MIRILLVEDDAHLGEMIREELGQKNFCVLWSQDVKSSHELMDRYEFDLAVIDLSLPDGQGFDLVGFLQCPVIVMSALNDPRNRLKGVELGVVDFIPKPFLLKELLLKIERSLGEKWKKQKLWSFEGVVLDMNKRQIVNKKETHFLNKRDFRTLDILINRCPQVVSRDGIINYVCGRDQSSSHRSVDNTILGLRHRLGDRHHRWIRSVRGEGYQWVIEGKGDQ